MTGSAITKCSGCGVETSEDYDGNGACYPCHVLALGLELAKPTKEVISVSSFVSSAPTPLGEDAYHGLAGEFVRIVEPESEADPAALLIQFLAATGCGLGDGPHASAEAARHPGRLFVVVVGESSKARKGSSESHVRKVVVWSFDGFSDQIVSGASSGEGLIARVSDPEPNDDGDIPAVDKRVLVVESEFVQILRQMQRQGNTLSPALRNLWDTGSAQILTRNNPVKASRAHLCVIGHITVDELRKELSAVESSNGLANRIIWVWSRRSKLLPEGGNVDDAALLKLAEELDRVAKWASKSRLLKRTDEARTLWAGEYERLSEPLPGLVGAVTSRSEAQVLRLSVLYAALDRSEEITIEHLRAALEVWRYCEDSARLIFGDKTGDKLADRLRGLLRSAGKSGLSLTEIQNLTGRNLNSEDLDAALARLSRDGLAVMERRSTGGRPESRWYETNEVTEISPLTDRQAA
jgi:hypothetical protein